MRHVRDIVNKCLQYVEPEFVEKHHDRKRGNSAVYFGYLGCMQWRYEKSMNAALSYCDYDYNSNSLYYAIDYKDPEMGVKMMKFILTSMPFGTFYNSTVMALTDKILRDGTEEMFQYFLEKYPMALQESTNYNRELIAKRGWFSSLEKSDIGDNCICRMLFEHGKFKEAKDFFERKRPTNQQHQLIIYLCKDMEWGSVFKESELDLILYLHKNGILNLHSYRILELCVLYDRDDIADRLVDWTIIGDDDLKVFAPLNVLSSGHWFFDKVKRVLNDQEWINIRDKVLYNVITLKDLRNYIQVFECDGAVRDQVFMLMVKTFRYDCVEELVNKYKFDTLAKELLDTCDYFEILFITVCKEATQPNASNIYAIKILLLFDRIGLLDYFNTSNISKEDFFNIPNPSVYESIPGLDLIQYGIKYGGSEEILKSRVEKCQSIDYLKAASKYIDLATNKNNADYILSCHIEKLSSEDTKWLCKIAHVRNYSVLKARAIEIGDIEILEWAYTKTNIPPYNISTTLTNTLTEGNVEIFRHFAKYDKYLVSMNKNAFSIYRSVINKINPFPLLKWMVSRGFELPADAFTELIGKRQRLEVAKYVFYNACTLSNVVQLYRHLMMSSDNGEIELFAYCSSLARIKLAQDERLIVTLDSIDQELKYKYGGNNIGQLLEDEFNTISEERNTKRRKFWKGEEYLALSS